MAEETIQEQFNRFTRSMERQIEILELPKKYENLMKENVIEIMKNAVMFFADKEIGNQIK